ncbi:N-acetyltransferase [Myroides sp. 1354]|uniref:hypothetical protein n=1 Tax=unclassified Myroides TaxID=2642485 RepID=UPI002577E29C|nr:MULTISPECIES: hypothetical protein [unclassified Myroides]MDM1043947.1 N-acetyltransferase [Myroides sp. R163-1]MDM1054882.1 N-acetyltransferase [Myroides sp. 1354]MDM1068179.1 N-acetyltransferase [Myroides sp. 1372]
MEIRFFRDINLQDPFFDSLKAAYAEFEDWYNRKAGENKNAIVHFADNGEVDGFLFLKIEDNELTDVVPNRAAATRLKVGTFKINPHGTRLGERFIKKIMDVAIHCEVEEIYVTIFEEHIGLIQLLEKYGFERGGTKTTANGVEQVLFKNMRRLTGNVVFDYPLMQVNGKRKVALSIYPIYHSEMFPDSILVNENYDLIRDISHTNSIHKIYVCYMFNVNALRPGDIVCIYRTSDGLGPAHYRSVITSVCIVEEVKTRADFNNLDDFLRYTNSYSIFDEEELRNDWVNDRPNLTVVKMTYNIALKRRITKQILTEDLNINPRYWGFYDLTDEQFNQILERGEVYENIIVN